MTNKLWKLDHIGHAVNDLEKSIEHYQKLFGFNVISRESIAEQHVDIAFIQLENTLIELLSPQEGNTNLKNFLSKRGEGLHHICYQVKSVSKELKRLESLGAKLIDITPRAGSRGMHIAFIHPHSTNGVLTELCGEY